MRMDHSIPFSVLMSVYHKEQPAYLDACLASLENQTLHPDEAVVVEDGPISDDLRTVLAHWKQRLPFPLKTVPLKENVGLGRALATGLGHCAFEWIARMDTDDICVPSRFALQVDYIHSHPELSLLGGQISEFEESPEYPLRVKRVPEYHTDIGAFSKKRNPFNHMTVMFRKSAVLEAGNYQHVPGFEDYDLWVRLIQGGFRTGNLPDILVYARVASLDSRRSGSAYIKQMNRFQRRLLSRSYIGVVRYSTNFLTRAAVAAAPNAIRKLLYGTFLRKKTNTE